MPRKMLKRAFLSLYILKYSGGGARGGAGRGGGHAPVSPLAARAFGARNLPRLVLKSGYGPDLNLTAEKISSFGEPRCGGM